MKLSENQQISGFRVIRAASCPEAGGKVIFMEHEHNGAQDVRPEKKPHPAATAVPRNRGTAQGQGKFSGRVLFHARVVLR